MDMREMVDKVKKNEPLYGKSSLTPYMQGVASRNSRYSGIWLHVIPWFNFVNHDQVSSRYPTAHWLFLLTIVSMVLIQLSTTDRQRGSWLRKKGSVLQAREDSPNILYNEGVGSRVIPIINEYRANAFDKDRATVLFFMGRISTLACCKTWKMCAKSEEYLGQKSAPTIPSMGIISLGATFHFLRGSSGRITVFRRLSFFGFGSGARQKMSMNRGKSLSMIYQPLSFS